MNSVNYCKPSNDYANFTGHRRARVYRPDNAPHLKWQSVSTFPKHYHDGSEGNVTASYISDDPEQAVREFLLFVRETMQGISS